MQVKKTIEYIITGAQILGAIGTIYGLFDAPRKERENVRAMDAQISKEVDKIIKEKIDAYVDSKFDANIEKKIKERVEEAMNNKMNDIDGKIDAILAAREMRKGKNGQSSK